MYKHLHLWWCTWRSAIYKSYNCSSTTPVAFNQKRYTYIWQNITQGMFNKTSIVFSAFDYMSHSLGSFEIMPRHCPPPRRERHWFCCWCVWCLLVLICYSLTRCLFSLPFCWSQRRSPVSVPLPPPPWVSAHMSHTFRCLSLPHFAFGLSGFEPDDKHWVQLPRWRLFQLGSARLPIRTWTESSRFPKSLVHLFTTSVVPAVGENVHFWQLDPLISYFSHFLLPCLPLTPTSSSVSCTVPPLVLAAPLSMSLCICAGTHCQSTQSLFKVKLDR